MGPLSTNRSALLSVYPDSARLLYVVDFAEVPSVPELERLRLLGADAYAPFRMQALLPALSLGVDGRASALRIERCIATTRTGEGGLPVVGLLCDLRTDALPAGRLVFSDGNFAGTVGWREMSVIGEGVRVSEGLPDFAVPSHARPAFTTPPARMNLAHVEATVGGDAGATPNPPGVNDSGSAPLRPADALSALIGGAELSPRFILLALLSAMFLGAAHALSPGHGKTLVAAYLVGARGTVQQAILLGLVVTVTHVSSVALLGLVTLFLSKYVLAASLYPWIGVTSGAGVMAVGAGLLRARLGTRRAVEDEHDGFAQDKPADGAPSLRRLLLLGVTGGAVPCPSALVVLLSAVALHRITFGMLLIAAFSMGLAGVLVGIGVAVVRAQGWLRRMGAFSRPTSWLPVASAVVVVALGLAIAVQSAREGGLW